MLVVPACVHIFCVRCRSYSAAYASRARQCGQRWWNRSSQKTRFHEVGRFVAALVWQKRLNHSIWCAQKLAALHYIIYIIYERFSCCCLFRYCCWHDSFPLDHAGLCEYSMEMRGYDIRCGNSWHLCASVIVFGAKWRSIVCHARLSLECLSTFITRKISCHL